MSRRAVVEPMNDVVPMFDDVVVARAAEVVGAADDSMRDAVTVVDEGQMQDAGGVVVTVVQMHAVVAGGGAVAPADELRTITVEAGIGTVTLLLVTGTGAGVGAMVVEETDNLLAESRRGEGFAMSRRAVVEPMNDVVPMFDDVVVARAAEVVGAADDSMRDAVTVVDEGQMQPVAAEAVVQIHCVVVTTEGIVDPGTMVLAEMIDVPGTTVGAGAGAMLVAGAGAMVLETLNLLAASCLRGRVGPVNLVFAVT